MPVDELQETGVTARRFTVALSELSRAQKPGRGAPPYSRWINRRMGRVIAAAAYVVGLTPNGVTVISALFTFSALALIALVPPTIGVGILIGVLLILGYALDAADGQLARLTGRGSRAGGSHHLDGRVGTEQAHQTLDDHMVDVTKTCVLHAVVLISFFRFGGVPSPAYLLVPLGYLTVSVMFFFGLMLVDQLRRAARTADAPAAPTGGGLFQTIAAIPTDYGILCVVFLSFGYRPVFLVLYGLMFLGHALVLCGTLVKWWRDLRAIDASAS